MGLAGLERRQSLLSTLLFIIIIFMTLASTFNLPPAIALGGLILILAVVALVYAGQKRVPGIPGEPGPPPTKREEAFRLPQGPILGRWVAIPISLAAVIGFIVFENWWLNVTIRASVFLRKAATDWWGITYLNNTYFYAILTIGALVAISDPRLIIAKTPEGKRRYFLHSKVWGLVNAIRGQIYEFQTFSPFPTPSALGQPYDQISLKRGILWKLLEFAGGCLIIAPSFAKDWSFRFLLVSKWVETQGITWFELIGRAARLLYSRLVLAETPTGVSLIDNSPIFEFLFWIRVPIVLLGAIWGIRLFISFIFELRAGRAIKAFRNIIVIVIIVLSSILVITPTQAFDVTTPYYLRSMLFGWGTLTIVAVFLSLHESWVQPAVGHIFRRRIVLTVLVLMVALSLLYGPVVVAVQINPSIQGRFVDYLWIPKYLPNVEYTRWATGVEPITEDRIQTAMNTGENLQILSSVRLFNREAANLRLKPSIGVNWMDLTAPDIINIGGNEYWISALTIVQPPGGGDTWRAARLLITHSERVLGINAHDGQVLLNAAQTVFGVPGIPAIYYGEGGLFASSMMVYVGVPGFAETHLPEYTGPPGYSGEPDYVLRGFERFWFFSGLFGQERLEWGFGGGSYGDVKMLYLRDVSTRVKQILLPGLTLDDDPYLVSDGKDLYYSFFVYIERDMPTEYLDYPNYSLKFYRLFATVLVNTYDGSITGYLLGLNERNYLLDFYRSMYPQWSKPVPSWLVPQLRYPEFLFDKQIVSYNTYHVSDADKWQKLTDFFQLTTDAAGRPIEEVRFVTFSLNRRSLWAGVRLVEGYRAPGKNLAGVYVALNGEEFGKVYLLRAGNVAIIGPQTALDTINNFAPTREQLTLHPAWISGNTLTYVINGTIYYFIPYYAPSATTTNMAMMVVVDALSQKVGYYVISNPQDATEVAGATEKAYMNLVGVVVAASAEVRKQNVFKEFQGLNYTLKTPQQLNPNVAYHEGSADYLKDEDLPKVKTLIQSFASRFVYPTGTRTILLWETKDGTRSNLNFGVLSTNLGVVELHFITVTYATG
jgi:hypothetical protein